MYYAKAIETGLQADEYPAIPEYDEKDILPSDYPLDENPVKIPQFKKIINDSITDGKLSIKTYEAIGKCCVLHNLGYKINVDWQLVYAVLNSFISEDKNRGDIYNVTGVTMYCIALLAESKLKLDEDIRVLYSSAWLYFLVFAIWEAVLVACKMQKSMRLTLELFIGFCTILT